MSNSPGIIIAFIAGIFSIFSPCILPILPSFIGYITGVSLSDTHLKLNKRIARRKLFINTLMFGVGFSITFLLFGAVIGFIGEALALNRSIFQTIGGIIITIFGLQLTGLINIRWLMKGRKIEIHPHIKKLEYFRSLMTGIFFAFGWAPCYGPIIGAILTLAATEADFGMAILLFFFYSLGFLVPLFIFTLIIANTTHHLKKINKIAKYSSVVAGGFVMLLGILLMTNQLDLLVNWIDIAYNSHKITLF